MRKTTLNLLLAMIILTGCQSTPAPTPVAEEPAEESETPPAESETPPEEPDGIESTLVLDDTYADYHSAAIDYVGRAEVRGVMQIYWRTVRSGTDGVEKSLRMRFFVAEGEAERLPEIESEHYDRTPSLLYFYTERNPETLGFDSSTIEEQAGILVEDFEEIPDNFFRYQEGHVEQPGTLVFRDLSSVIECDSPDTLVRLESFEPSSIDGEHRELVDTLRSNDGSTGGCERRPPYLETFRLAEGQDVYTEADLESPVVEGNSVSMVIKIETYDDDWVEVYSYSDPDVRGFVRTEELTR